MTQTHWFYSPHPDDEALGMAGAIVYAIAAGHATKLVLVTDSRPTVRMIRMLSGQMRCHWHNSKGHTVAVDLHRARRNEFQLSAMALGVPDVRYWNLPEEDTDDGQAWLADQIFERIINAEAESRARAVHHLVAAPDDLTFEDRIGNRSHRACWDAGVRAAAAGYAVRFHRVYHYSFPIDQRRSPIVVQLAPWVMDKKRAALAVYRRWSPALGHVAYGFHSVPELFTGAEGDPREFMDPVPVTAGV